MAHHNAREHVGTSPRNRAGRFARAILAFSFISWISIGGIMAEAREREEMVRDDGSKAQGSKASEPGSIGAGRGPGSLNRLADSKSPYLLQHAENPVDWYPWGEEAFELAREEDRPIFLSIGYSTCHWCHVMAHESFEDPRWRP